MATLAIIFAFAWFIRMVENILFQVTLWQRKEYRLDRMRAHLVTSAGLKLLLNPFSLIKWLLVALFLLHDYAHIPYYFRPGWLLLIAGLIWTVEAIGALIRLSQHRTTLPIITLRSGLLIILLVLLTLKPVTMGFLQLWGLMWNNFYYEWFWRHTYLLGLFADRSLPIYTFLLSVLTQPFVSIQKRRLVTVAHRRLQQHHPKWVIGITGSYGKTSTKEFLAHILSRKFRVLKTSEHVNADIGIARQVLKELKPEHEVYIVEMGAYHIGAIKRDCEMVRPNIGILTAIAPQHLALFGSMERLIMAKSELFGALPTDGLAMANGDSRECREIAKVSRAPVKFYGTREPADIWIDDIQMTFSKTSFMVHTSRQRMKCEANLIGDWFILNLLAAISVANYLGMSLDEISRAIKNLKPISRTMEVLSGVGESIVIDDSYSANPDGVIAAIKALSIFPHDAQKILVMPSLIELGEKSHEEHVRIGETAGAICDAIYLTDSDKIKAIKQGVQKVADPAKVQTLKPSLIINKLISNISKGDVVLIEGRVPDIIRSKLINLKN